MNKLWKGMMTALLVCALVMSTLTVALAAQGGNPRVEDNAVVDPDPATPKPATPKPATPRPTRKATPKPTRKPTPTPKPVPKSVKLNKSGTVELKKGKALQLKATVSPSGASTTLTWSSSKPKVAKVSSSGKVTALSAGVTTITVKTSNGKKATVKVSVYTQATKSGITIKLDGKNALTVSGKGTLTGLGTILSDLDIDRDKIKAVVVKGFTEIDAYEFSDMASLTKVTISGVHTIGIGAFEYDPKLTTVTIKSGVRTISRYAFEFCPKLKTVKLCKGIRVIGAGAFEGCTALSSLSLPSSVTRIGFAAFEGTSIKKLTLPKAVKMLGDLAGDNVEGDIFGIDDHSHVTLRGYKGSYAQKYAKRWNYKFEAIS